MGIMKTFRTILLCAFAAIAMFGLLLVYDIIHAMFGAVS